MNYLKNKHNNKAVTVISLVFLFLFLSLNIVWVLYREIRYGPLVENVPVNYGVRIISIEDYSYSVTEPQYMSFSGNLSLTNELTDESLIIWPLFPNGYKYAVMLHDADSSKSIFVYVDKNGNFLASTDGSNESEEIFDKKREQVNEMVTLANDMWDL